MSKYVLRWQYGIVAEEIKVHYTYGDLDMLRYKASVLAENNRVTYISIDEIKEVIKDIRHERIENLIESN